MTYPPLLTESMVREEPYGVSRGRSVVKRVWVVIFLFLSMLDTRSWAQGPRALGSDSVMSFLTVGVSEARLGRLVKERGISFRVTEECAKRLQLAGATVNLIAQLRAQKTDSSAPSTCNAELARVASLTRAGDYRTAEKGLRGIMMRSATNDGVLEFTLGALLSKQEQWDAASDVLTDAAGKMSGLPEVHSQLAYVFYRIDDGDNAIAEARTALSLDPQNAEAYRLLGLGFYSNGKYLAALNAFEQSLMREPNNADVYYDMGVTLRDQGDLRGAAVAYRRALKLRPNFWEAHSNLGIVLHDQGKMEEALAEYRAAKALAPEEPSVRNNIGTTFCDKGDFDSAIAEFRELRKTNPTWDGGHNCLARAFMAKRDFEAAITELRAALQKNPTGGVRAPSAGTGIAGCGQGRRSSPRAAQCG